MGCSTASSWKALLDVTVIYYLLLFTTLAGSDIPMLYIIQKVFIGPNIDCCEGLEESLWLDNFV